MQLAIYRITMRQTKLSHHTGSNFLYVTNIIRGGNKLGIEMKLMIKIVFYHQYYGNHLE